MKKMPYLLLAGLTFSFSSHCFAWGERGHQTVSASAARLLGQIEGNSIDSHSKAHRNYLAFSKFFLSRSSTLGHVSNLPDTSWRDSTQKRRIEVLNAPTHFFAVENLLGAPARFDGSEFSEYLNKVRQLPTDYADLKKKFQNQKNPLPGVPESMSKIDFYFDLGVAPYYAQYLHGLMTEALRCAKKKEEWQMAMPFPQAYPPVAMPFREPEDKIGEETEPELPSYVCQQGLSRRSDLYAATVIAGLLSHYIGDMSQPNHPSADTDGWTTGNGGIHGYFEEAAVQSSDAHLEGEVYDRAANEPFRTDVWNRLGTRLSEENAVAQLMLNLAADSLSHLKELLNIDTQIAIKKVRSANGKLVVKMSERLEYGDNPKYYKGKMIKRAERLDSSDPRVQAAFRPLMVQRLATSSVLLSHLWKAAWELAGRPNLSTESPYSVAYPLDVPFIWPDFDAEALRDSRRTEKKQHFHLAKASSEEKSKKWWRDPKYPESWWTEIDRDPEHPEEVLPHQAGPGEVVLSKRNELGLLSHFAATPFKFQGKEYASVEGFWQMMLYPDPKDPEDPRRDPKLQWKYTREQVGQMVGFSAKEAGDLALKNMEALGIDWVSFNGQRMEYQADKHEYHYNLITEALRAKIRQNKKARDVLLSTENLKLIPDVQVASDLPDEWKYHEVYMKIRSEYK